MARSEEQYGKATWPCDGRGCPNDTVCFTGQWNKVLSPSMKAGQSTWGCFPTQWCQDYPCLASLSKSGFRKHDPAGKLRQPSRSSNLPGLESQALRKKKRERETETEKERPQTFCNYLRMTGDSFSKGRLPASSPPGGEERKSVMLISTCLWH